MVANSSGRTEKEVIVSVGCDSGDGGGSGETNRPVPVSEFGVYVAQHHAQGNKMFSEVYQVKWVLYGYTLYSVPIHNLQWCHDDHYLWTCYWCAPYTLHPFCNCRDYVAKLCILHNYVKGQFIMYNIL